MTCFKVWETVSASLCMCMCVYVCMFVFDVCGKGAFSLAWTVFYLYEDTVERRERNCA